MINVKLSLIRKIDDKKKQNRAFSCIIQKIILKMLQGALSNFQAHFINDKLFKVY